MADTPSTARRIAEFVNYLDTLTAKLAEVEAERDALRAALVTIANGQECSNYTGCPCRFDASRTKDCYYTADRWCDACIANDALSPSPVEGGQ
jgi:hypothetical protein